MTDPTACELIQRLADALETWRFGCGSTAADTCVIQAARAYLAHSDLQRRRRADVKPTPNPSQIRSSDAAQAVLDEAMYRTSAGESEDYVCWIVASALRALADQVVPPPRLPYDSCCDVYAAAIRAEILAVAAELEGAN
mgnify:CR=1 FL=1